MTYDKYPIHYFAQDIKKYLKKGKSRGLIFGNFGACNTGDEAILAGQLLELKKINTTKVSVVSRFPRKIKELHKIEAIFFKNPLTIIHQISISDYIIIGGGGIFCKNDSGFKGILFQIYTLLIFIYLPLLLNKKIFALGLGFYSNSNKFISLLALLGLSKAAIISVRDVSTYTYLKSKRLNVSLYKDNSFLLPIKPAIYSQKLHGIITKYYIVGIAVNAPLRKADQIKLAKEIANFINENSHTTHFIFYSLDYHPSYFNDRKFNKIINRLLNKNASVSFFPLNSSPNELFSSFSLTDFMITSRLHASIFSYRLGVPFYSVSYDLKCESFLKSISHQYTSASAVTSSDIARYFQAAKIKKREKDINNSLNFDSLNI